MFQLAVRSLSTEDSAVLTTLRRLRRSPIPRKKVPKLALSDLISGAKIAVPPHTRASIEAFCDFTSCQIQNVRTPNKESF